MNKRRLLSLLLCVALLAGLISTTGLLTAVAESVTPWADGDAVPTEGNWLATSIIEEDASANCANSGSPKLEAAVTAMTDGTATNRGIFYLDDYEENRADVKNVVTGEPVVGTGGIAQIAFNLNEYVAVSSVFVMGNTSGSTAAGWSYASEDSAKNYWGENYVLDGGRYYAADAPSGNKRTFNDKNLLYYEVYVSDDLGTLFEETSRVLVYDNATTLHLGATHTLDTPVAGQYVGMRISGGSGNKVNIGELGVFGEVAVRLDTGITPWANGDAVPTEGNWLATSIIEEDASANCANSGSPKLEAAVAAMTDGTATNRGIFYLDEYEENRADVKNVVTGEPVVGTGGIAQIAFKLNECVAVSSVFVMGNTSGSSAATWSYAGESTAQSYWGENYVLDGERYYAADAPSGNKRTFNDKNLLYYEVYVSDSVGTLFEEANRVLVYDNAATLLLGATHALDTPVAGQYVGMRISGGSGNKVNIGELGVFGEVAVRLDPNTTPWVSGNAIDKDNNLLTEATRQRDDSVGNALASNLGAGAPANTFDGTAEKIAKYYTYDAECPAGYAEVTNPTTGDPIVGSGGWARAAFRLAEYSEVTKLAVIGAPNESNAAYWSFAGEQTAKDRWGENGYIKDEIDGRHYAAYSDGTKRTFNNRNILYYEVYMADTFESLFDADNLVLSYDNTTTLYDGVIHTLSTPAYGQYIGYRVTAGSGTLAYIGELGVYGQKADKNAVFTTTTSDGRTVSVSVSANSISDRDGLKETIGGVKLIEEKLPSTVKTNINSNWLTVDDATVYRVQLLDKNNALFPLTAAESLGGLNGREVQVSIASNVAHMQVFGKLENGKITRLFNSRKTNDGFVIAGTLDYPVYEEGTYNNRDSAALVTNDISLVFLKWNDLDTINKLSGTVVNTPLSEFKPTVAAGVQDTAAPALLWLVPVALLLVGAATLLVWRRHRVN